MTRQGSRPAFDPGDPLLPVAGRGVLSGVRRSRRSVWRAAVLIGVHVLILLHVTHFLVNGSTLSPVEPSEAMYTLELGQLNAGFLFFVVALLSTAIFGRFFCGWGCHIVALQDLCGWILRRLSIRPRPFRSRLLLWAPMVLALYMFVWPTIRRLVLPAAVEFPGFTNHLVTDSFWQTFPGPVFAVVTFLTCGFAAVYFLGAKGFCTYGCPYGAFFGALDRVAPGRILVTDDCEQCGHCTATCTSNVRVHDEVRRFGRVVDPGCMKCMDCISVCPKHALYFGFSTPSLWSRPRVSDPRAPFGSLSWANELLVAGACLVSTLAFWGLYDKSPLLMSLGLGGITAFLVHLLWRLVSAGTVRLQNLNLKLGGTFQASGRVFVALAVLWLTFTAHSAFVQWHRFLGAQALEQTEASRSEVLRGVHQAREYSPGHHVATKRAHEHFAAAQRWGLLPVLEVKLGLVWTHLLRDELEAAEARLREAVALAPSRADLRDDHVELLLGRGRPSDAVAVLLEKIDSPAAAAQDVCRVAGMLAAAEDGSGAIRHYRTCVAEFPDSFEARYNLGGLLRRADRPDEALSHLKAATQLRPDDFDARVELGLVHMARDEASAARDALARAVELDPDRPESRFHLRGLIQQLDRQLAGE